MRKRIVKSRDEKSSQGSGGRSGSARNKSIEGGDWAMESRFSKPTIKKSSLRLAAAKEAAESKAYKGKPSNFKESRGNSFGETRGEKSRFAKPEFEKSRDRQFGKGRDDRGSEGAKPYRSFESRENRDNSRPFPPKGGSEESRFSKPKFGDGKRFGKPGFEKGSYGERKGGFERPFQKNEESTDGKRTEFKKPFERRSEGKFERKTFDKSAGFTKERGSDRVKVSGEERRVGKLEHAPKYNLNRYDDKKVSKKVSEEVESTEMRLNRYIANAGICSRREADELIASGQISVNGKVITEMGHKVQKTDVVKFGKKSLNPEKMVYILINKPKDYITTTDDPEERKTVLDLIAGACEERIYPVGRLDRNTTGLLLLTNDGELAEKLTHPSSGIKKIYQAELDKPITNEHFELLKHGLELEDGFIRPDEVGIVTPDAMVVGLEIHSGRNRIVRRMFEHLGYEVQKLDRTVFAGLNKKDLPRGKWRFMLEKEVIKLKYMM